MSTRFWGLHAPEASGTLPPDVTAPGFDQRDASFGGGGVERGGDRAASHARPSGAAHYATSGGTCAPSGGGVTVNAGARLGVARRRLVHSCRRLRHWHSVLCRADRQPSS